MNSDMFWITLTVGAFALSAGILLGQAVRLRIYPSQSIDYSTTRQANWALIGRVAYLVGTIAVAYVSTDRLSVLVITAITLAAFFLIALLPRTMMDRLSEEGMQRVVAASFIFLFGIGAFVFGRAVGAPIAGTILGIVLALLGLLLLITSIRDLSSDS